MTGSGYGKSSYSSSSYGSGSSGKGLTFGLSGRSIGISSGVSTTSSSMSRMTQMAGSTMSSYKPSGSCAGCGSSSRTVTSSFTGR